jgi:microcystin-dependent protein
MPLIELGLIDGNYWNAGHVDAVEAAINTSCQAGDIRMSIATAETPGWLLLNGQVVANAQVLYPDLWTKVPVGWKSGAALNLPNATVRMPIGQDSTHPVGTVGGASTRTLAAANLPPHTHAGTTGNQNAMHWHAPGNYAAGDQFVVQRFPGPHAVFDVNDTSTGATIQSYPGLTEEKAFDGAGGVGWHQHPFTTDGGNVGSAPVDVTPAWIAFNFFIKAH